MRAESKDERKTRKPSRLVVSLGFWRLTNSHASRMRTHAQTSSKVSCLHHVQRNHLLRKLEQTQRRGLSKLRLKAEAVAECLMAVVAVDADWLELPGLATGRRH